MLILERTFDEKQLACWLCKGEGSQINHWEYRPIFCVPTSHRANSCPRPCSSVLSSSFSACSVPTGLACMDCTAGFPLSSGFQVPVEHGKQRSGYFIPCCFILLSVVLTVLCLSLTVASLGNPTPQCIVSLGLLRASCTPTLVSNEAHQYHCHKLSPLFP